MEYVKNIIAALALLLPAAQMTAQITADANFSDSTRYFVQRAGSITKKQDKIFVFFAKEPGKTPRPNKTYKTSKLTATRSIGTAAVFRWEKLAIDSITNNNRRQIYLPLYPDRSDSLENTSATKDSLPDGCYRVLIDTVGVNYIDTLVCSGADTIHCDTLHPSPELSVCNAQILPPDTCYRRQRRYFIDRDSIVFVDYVMSTALHRADTFRAWVFMDTFMLCKIDTVRREDPCGGPGLEGWFYWKDADGGCSRDPFNKFKKYYDLSDSLVEEITIPFNKSASYIKSVKWTPTLDGTTPVDIHKDAEGIAVEDPAWNSKVSTTIPRPLWDAAYKLEIENYFGNIADTITDTIKAHSVFAKIKIATSNDGAGWKPFETPQQSSKYDAYLYLQVKDASINAKNGSRYEWNFYGSDDVDSSSSRAPLCQHVATDTSVVELSSICGHIAGLYPYIPGVYPLKMMITNQHGCKDTVKIKIEVNEFLMETGNFTEVFSPASANNNLHFKVKDPDKAKSVTRFEISVLNRFGQLMFSSSDLHFQWDGKIRGSDEFAPDGVYFYAARAHGLDRKGNPMEQKLKGVVHLFGSR